jgi:hypothetical protein
VFLWCGCPRPPCRTAAWVLLEIREREREKLEGRHAKNLGELAATTDARDFGNRRGFIAVWLGYGTPTRTSYLGTIRTAASDDPPPIKPKLELGAVNMARRVRYRGGTWWLGNSSPEEDLYRRSAVACGRCGGCARKPQFRLNSSPDSCWP